MRRSLDPVEVNRRRLRMQFRIVLTAHLVLAWAIVGVAAWLITHPESIGAFFRAIANGFSGAGTV